MEGGDYATQNLSFGMIVRSILSGIGHCCWIFCCPPCPCEMIRKCAFQPPKPTYYFTSENSKKKITKATRKTRDLYPLRIGLKPSKLLFPQTEETLNEMTQELTEAGAECFFTKTAKGSWIACLFYPCQVKPAKFTIFYSHPNATDLGLEAETVKIRSLYWHCNIFAYDFSGYGLSSGRCSTEGKLYSDTSAAYAALLERYKLAPQEIILMGRSLGTAAIIDLASNVSGVAGVVLISPFESALRIFCRSKKRKHQETDYCMDQFVSIQKIRGVKAPVLFVHGIKDKITPFSHGLGLYQNCPSSVCPVWVADAEHNDLQNFLEFWTGIRRFISEDLGRGPVCMELFEEFAEKIFRRRSINIHPKCFTTSCLCQECIGKNCLCHVCTKNRTDLIKVELAKKMAKQTRKPQTEYLQKVAEVFEGKQKTMVETGVQTDENSGENDEDPPLKHSETGTTGTGTNTATSTGSNGKN